MTSKMNCTVRLEQYALQIMELSDNKISHGRAIELARKVYIQSLLTMTNTGDVNTIIQQVVHDELQFYK